MNELTPNVITMLKFSDRTFRFEVAAYRKVTRQEAAAVLHRWMVETHRKELPKTGAVRYSTLIGLN